MRYRDLIGFPRFSLDIPNQENTKPPVTKKEDTTLPDQQNINGRLHLHRVGGKMVYAPPLPPKEMKTGPVTMKRFAPGSHTTIRFIPNHYTDLHEGRFLKNLMEYLSDYEWKRISPDLFALLGNSQWTPHVPGDPKPEPVDAKRDHVVLNKYRGLGHNNLDTRQNRNLLHSCWEEPLERDSGYVKMLFWRLASDAPMPVFSGVAPSQD